MTFLKPGFRPMGKRLRKILFLTAISILICTFLPWFPGDVLYEDTPLTLYSMLLNINNLDIDFLDSYNILRMGTIIPLSLVFLFLWIGFREDIRRSPFLIISPIIIITASIFFFILEELGWLWGAFSCMILISGIGSFSIHTYRHNQLNDFGYIFCLLFTIISAFLYHFHLCQSFYHHLDPLHVSETYGFWLSWTFFVFLILILFTESIMKRRLINAALLSIVLSAIGYYALTHPFFMSGPVLFFADNLQTVGVYTASHIQIVAIALAIAIFTGVPVGIHITRHPKLAGIVLYVASIIITIPSIALFGFMMPILSSIDRSWDAVSGIGIGKVPAIIALALYALLPIIRNTYIAIINIDPGIIEAGRGMGMTGRQLLVKLQIPLAVPVIMAGVRTAVVMSIAIAAVAAYIGAGGLGLFVSEGLQMATNDSVVAGAICMSLLAVIADYCFDKAGKWLTPAGLRVER